MYQLSVWFCYGTLLLRSSSLKTSHLIFLSREGTRGMDFVTQIEVTIISYGDKFSRDICPCNICPGGNRSLHLFPRGSSRNVSSDQGIHFVFFVSFLEEVICRTNLANNNLLDGINWQIVTYLPYKICQIVSY